MICFIFSAVLAFIFSNKANILDSALTNYFCHCHRLKVRQILLVQSQIFGLKNQMHRQSNRSLLLFSSAENASISLSDHVEVSN